MDRREWYEWLHRGHGGKTSPMSGRVTARKGKGNDRTR
jgi:hypothetical protein